MNNRDGNSSLCKVWNHQFFFYTFEWILRKLSRRSPWSLSSFINKKLLNSISTWTFFIPWREKLSVGCLVDSTSHSHQNRINGSMKASCICCLHLLLLLWQSHLYPCALHQPPTISTLTLELHWGLVCFAPTACLASCSCPFIDSDECRSKGSTQDLLEIPILTVL